MERAHKAEHDRLRDMIDAYIAVLRDGQPDIEHIMRWRLAFSNAHRAHMASETLAFQQLRTGNADDPVERLLDERARLQRETMPGYSALISNWTPARIVADWPEYCRQVRTQVKRYYAYLDWEEANILPLLDRLPRSGAGDDNAVNASYRATSSG